jgi:omega-amidase
MIKYTILHIPYQKTGSIINKYRKTHLFDVLIKDKITFIESDTLSPGDSINTFDTEIGRMGVGICYDIRFPELFKKLSLGGAEILVVPGAFNTITGPAHWRLLARSRAIDNQCFILMASPALNRDSSYHAYGHSLVCDPWGTILCEAGHNEELIDTKISLDYLKTVRAELPLLKHRRDDLY